jgi:hypothetical protein
VSGELIITELVTPEGGTVVDGHGREVDPEGLVRVERDGRVAVFRVPDGVSVDDPELRDWITAYLAMLDD